jgi:hypothetical protein
MRRQSIVLNLTVRQRNCPDLSCCASIPNSTGRGMADRLVSLPARITFEEAAAVPMAAVFEPRSPASARHPGDERLQWLGHGHGGRFLALGFGHPFAPQRRAVLCAGDLSLQLGQLQYHAAWASLAGLAGSRALRGRDLSVGLVRRTNERMRSGRSSTWHPTCLRRGCKPGPSFWRQALSAGKCVQVNDMESWSGFPFRGC